MRTKITIVGAGNVGASAAQWLLQRGIADIALVDVVPGLAEGKALDLWEATPAAELSVHVVGSSDLAVVAGSEVVVFTAGEPRRPGMTRDDLLAANLAALESVVPSIVDYAPEARLIVVTNPVDVLTFAALRLSGWAPARVMGMAGILDTTRFRTFLSAELGVAGRDVHALVLGGHGDQMVPVVSRTTVGGVPVSSLLPKERLDQLVERTRFGGGEIVGLLKSGGAYVAPGMAVAEMVEAILLDQKRVLPVVAHLGGAYGHHDLAIGVPVVLGAAGVERVLEVELEPDEREMFERSARKVRDAIAGLGL